MKIENLKLISFSGGRTSAFMTIEMLKDEEVRNSSLIVFCNTGKECPETLDFVLQVSCYIYKHFKKNVIWLEYCPRLKFKVVNYATASRNGEPFAALIRKRKFVPNFSARYCTQELKVRVINHYLKSLGYKNWINCIGIRYDEPRRYSKVKEIKECWENYHPLVKWKITKPDVLNYFKSMPFDLQLLEHQGNCDLCFLKGSAKKQKIIKETPEKVSWWVKMEEMTGATFKRDYSYTDLVKKVKNAPPELFSDIDEIECTCNID